MRENRKSIGRAPIPASIERIDAILSSAALVATLDNAQRRKGAKAQRRLNGMKRKQPQ
jgi:hypothetical protein